MLICVEEGASEARNRFNNGLLGALERDQRVLGNLVMGKDARRVAWKRSD